MGGSKKKSLFLLTGSVGLLFLVFVLDMQVQRFSGIKFNYAVFQKEPHPTQRLTPSSLFNEEDFPKQRTRLGQLSLLVNQSKPPPGEPSKSTNFASSLSTFDWNGFKDAVSKKELTFTDTVKIETFQEELMHRLTPFLEMEPRVPINTSCLPPELDDPPTCSGHGSAFKGTRRHGPLPKIGILVQFGFGVDVLEIYLNEVYDIIDKFFIIESTRSHLKSWRKSLMWEKVKEQDRFRKFHEKIVHFVLDDAEVSAVKKMTVDMDKRIWKMEHLQERRRWTKFLEWNDAHKFFEGSDLLGFGDADEIPNRAMLHEMKLCDLKGSRIDFGIWFPFGRIHQAFKSDFPVLGHPFTLGDPTFWTVAAALRYSNGTRNKEIPVGRMRGTSIYFILGGIHMTRYGYLPFELMRSITCTECLVTMEELTIYSVKLRKGQIRDLELRLSTPPKMFIDRIVNVTSITNQLKEIALLPWFFNCNRDRYPVWVGGHDTRLD